MNIITKRLTQACMLHTLKQLLGSLPAEAEARIIKHIRANNGFPVSKMQELPEILPVIYWRAPEFTELLNSRISLVYSQYSTEMTVLEPENEVIFVVRLDHRLHAYIDKFENLPTQVEYLIAKDITKCQDQPNRNHITFRQKTKDYWNNCLSSLRGKVATWY